MKRRDAEPTSANSSERLIAACDTVYTSPREQAFALRNSTWTDIKAYTSWTEMNASDLSFSTPDGRRIAYAEWGNAAGIPVIYCHGFPGSRLEARLADAPARALGIRLIAPDRPGFGRSSFLPGRCFNDWPKDLAALSDALKLSHFDLIGVSGGAPYAIAGALALPERVGRIALVGGLGEFVGDDATSGMHAAAAAAINLQRRWPRLGRLTYLRLVGPMLARFPDLAFNILVGHATSADRAVLSDTKVRETLVASLAEAFREGSIGPAHEVDLITRRWDMDPAQVRQAVRLWHGEADRTVPVAMGRRHAALMPHNVSRFIPGEGHVSLMVRYIHQILADLVCEG